jgi:hypothetical protein
MSDKNSAKVLKVAVIVDGESCEELRQSEPGDIYIGRAGGSLSAGPSLDIEVGVAVEGPKSALLLPRLLIVIGLLMVVLAGSYFAFEVNKHVIENAALTKVDTEAAAAAAEDETSSTIALAIALLGVVPVVTGRTMLRGRRQRRRQELTVYDGWAAPKDYRKRAPIWLAAGVVLTLGGTGLFALEVSKHSHDGEITEARDMSVYKPAESEGTGGLGMLLGLLGLVPLVVGLVGLTDEPVAPPKRQPKGGQAPRSHRLFEWVAAEGTYYIDIPPDTKGKIALGNNKATVDALRKRFGQGDKLRVKLGDKAKGKLKIGQTQILFQTAKPARAAASPVFPPDLVDPLAHLRPTSLDTYTFVGAAVLAVLCGIWFWNFADRSPQPPAERFIKEMGLPASFYEEKKEEEPEEDAEKDTLEQKDEKKEEDKPDPEEEKELDENLTKPENVSDEAFQEARGVGVALVLGTYGGPGEGTVLDMIQDHENNLGELFAMGMTTTAESQGGPIGEFVAGGGGIDATGTVKSNEGIKTGEGPAEVGGTQKKERKVVSKTTTDEVVGDVDKQSVSATIRRRMPGLEACYEKALRSNPNLKGKMTYTITINPSGRVTDVSIEEDTVGDSSVRSCTEAKIKAWRFVLADGAEDSAEVTFSVSFTG